MSDDPKTLWCGNISEKVTEELLYELFLQAGPLERVSIPKDRDGRQKSFAFITFNHEVSVPYAINLFRGTALFNRKLTLQSRARQVLLPPPIRCSGPDPPIDFHVQNNMLEQFSEMTERLREDDARAFYAPRQGQDFSDKLLVASLQGNWSHRHHPYRQKDKMNNRNDHHRGREQNERDSRNKYPHTKNWRERRNNHKKGDKYHRRD